MPSVRVVDNFGASLNWDVIDLGRLEYAAAMARQREVHERVSGGKGGGRGEGVSEGGAALLLVEHEPVVTLSGRRGVRDHLLGSPEALAARGIAVCETDRGGDITYHGPGQLVAYPILRLADLGLNLGSYMRSLENAVIQTVATFGIRGHTEAGATGVWVGGRGPGSGVRENKPDVQEDIKEDPPEPRTPNPGPRTAKLCAMGVRIRRQTTMHGLALNVATDLEHFTMIDPCGLGGRPVTSLEQLLGSACPTMTQVKTELEMQLRRVLEAGPTRSEELRQVRVMRGAGGEGERGG